MLVIWSKLSQTLAASVNCKQQLERQSWPHSIQHLIPSLDPAPELAEHIQDTIVDEPPLSIADGGVIRDGIDPELDELRVIKRDASAWLAAYQARESEKCGIPKIKVGYNKVFGYYIEISKAHSAQAPDYFIRKQTLVNAERYITPELKEYEEKVLGADESIRNREQILFSDLRDEAESALGSIQMCADALAQLDVYAAFADNARRLHWCRPSIDESRRIAIGGGRHPVVERVIGRDAFVANGL